jgi:hypothetical protein
MIDQPTADQALAELEPLLGEWTLEAIPPGGEPWPGEATASFAWMESSDGRLLVERTEIEMPEAPNAVCVMGADAANGTFFQLYTDDRNVCRVYEMSIGDGEWKLWREGEPFNQRFIGRFTDDGNTIEGRWEIDEGEGWRTDFDLIYRRVGRK